MTPTLLTTLLLAPVPVERPGPTFSVTVRFEGKPAAGVTVWPTSGNRRRPGHMPWPSTSFVLSAAGFLSGNLAIAHQAKSNQAEAITAVKPTRSRPSNPGSSRHLRPHTNPVG
jgi:hypothetical protein